MGIANIENPFDLVIAKRSCKLFGEKLFKVLHILYVFWCLNFLNKFKLRFL